MKDIPAFPSKQKALMIKSEHVDIANEYEIEHNGMTLRDYFAAKAMQAWESRKDLDDIPDVAKARRFYELADAMMNVRKT